MICCGTSVFIPNYEATKNGSTYICKNKFIEFAPESVPDLQKYRGLAIEHIIELKSIGILYKSRGFTDEEIAYDGYRWREHVRLNPTDGWDWAMWEQSQLIALSIGMTYKDLSDKLFFDHPKFPHDLLHFVNPIFREIEETADNSIIFDFKKHNVKTELIQFLQSENGKIYTKISQRHLWEEVVDRGSSPIDSDYYPLMGMSSLLSCKNFDEALESEVTVYRGIEDGECPKYVKRAEIESWTVSRKMATYFAEGYYNSCNNPGTGTVLEKKIKFKEIMAFFKSELEIILKKDQK